MKRISYFLHFSVYYLSIIHLKLYFLVYLGWFPSFWDALMYNILMYYIFDTLTSIVVFKCINIYFWSYIASVNEYFLSMLTISLHLLCIFILIAIKMVTGNFAKSPLMSYLLGIPRKNQIISQGNDFPTKIM